MQKRLATYVKKAVQELRNFPEGKAIEVLDFIDFLKRKMEVPKETRKTEEIKFKAYDLGKMKEFKQEEIYEDYLSHRF